MKEAAINEQPICNRYGGTFETSPFRKFSEVSKACQPMNIDQNQPKTETGTPSAVSYLRLGDAAKLPKRTGRGGARNHADRQSHELTPAQIANLRAAETHSAHIGLPLTRMITIHWEAAGVPLNRMAKASGRFTDLLSKALSRHGAGSAWLWVHENGENKGGHCHMLAHVPAELVPTITRLQKGWLRRITGRPYRARVIHSRPIGGRLGLERGNPVLHQCNLQSALAYILKGASPDAALQFNLERLEPGGLIIGKRCATSQNIGAKARLKGNNDGQG